MWKANKFPVPSMPLKPGFFVVWLKKKWSNKVTEIDKICNAVFFNVVSKY